MKRIFTLLISALFSLSSYAEYEQTVTITFNNNNKENRNGYNKTLQVIIDGRSYYSNNNYDNGSGRNGSWGNGSLVLNNLQPGQHSISVNSVRDNNKYGNAGAIARPAYSSTFTVKQGYNLDIVIKENGKVAYIENPIRNGRRDDRDRDRRDNSDKDRRYNNDDNWRNNNGGYNYPNQTYARAMSDASFNDLLKDVRGKWFQSNKVSTVRNAFNNTANYFTTYQVKQLLETISSEGDRLELAKTAYRNVVDKNYFSQLYELFGSYASRDELDRYVRSYRY